MSTTENVKMTEESEQEVPLAVTSEDQSSTEANLPTAGRSVSLEDVTGEAPVGEPKRLVETGKQVYFVTGVSGLGKTTAIRRFSECEDIRIHSFDFIDTNVKYYGNMASSTRLARDRLVPANFVESIEMLKSMFEKKTVICDRSPFDNILYNIVNRNHIPLDSVVCESEIKILVDMIETYVPEAAWIIVVHDNEDPDSQENLRDIMTERNNGVDWEDKLSYMNRQHGVYLRFAGELVKRNLPVVVLKATVGWTFSHVRALYAELESRIRGGYCQMVKVDWRAGSNQYLTDGGVDLYLSEEVTVTTYPQLFETRGIHWIPPGYVGTIHPRSSAIRNNIIVFSGVVDSGYRGIIKVKAYIVPSNNPFVPDQIRFRRGESFAQLVISKRVGSVHYFDNDVTTSPITVVGERGLCSFGSTSRSEISD
jgi:dUTPase